MITREATAHASDSWEMKTTEQGANILQVGSRVSVTSYGPFRSLRGTIRTIDTIPVDLQESFCFYLVALDETSSKDPIWFEYSEVELVTSPLVTL